MTPSPAEALLSVSGLQVRYGAVLAVRDAGLRVARGELVAIIGNNGAGKTSILRGISGLVRPAAGRVVFDGEEVTTLAPHRRVRRGLVMIPEGRLIFADQTVEDNLILGAYSRGGLAKAEVREARERSLTLFPRLRERLQQPAGSLSGGEQQMLAIARGLLAGPHLLMIDELSLGLAPRVVDQLMGVLQELNAAGLTIILVEQLASHALAIADRAYVVANGQISLEGRAEELVRDPGVMEAFLGKKRAC